MRMMLIFLCLFDITLFTSGCGGMAKGTIVRAGESAEIVIGGRTFGPSGQFDIWTVPPDVRLADLKLVARKLERDDNEYGPEFQLPITAIWEVMIVTTETTERPNILQVGDGATGREVAVNVPPSMPSGFYAVHARFQGEGKNEDFVVARMEVLQQPTTTQPVKLQDTIFELRSKAIRRKH